MGWIVLLVIIGIVLIFISTYNRLVTARNAFKNAFAQIDVQLTRRYDLIPNLVETVKGYIKHERETLEAVIKGPHAAYAGLRPRPPIRAMPRPCNSFRVPTSSWGERSGG